MHTTEPHQEPQPQQPEDETNVHRWILDVESALDTMADGVDLTASEEEALGQAAEAMMHLRSNALTAEEAHFVLVMLADLGPRLISPGAGERISSITRKVQASLAHP